MTLAHIALEIPFPAVPNVVFVRFACHKATYLSVILLVFRLTCHFNRLDHIAYGHLEERWLQFMAIGLPKNIRLACTFRISSNNMYSMYVKIRRMDTSQDAQISMRHFFPYHTK